MIKHLVSDISQLTPIDPVVISTALVTSRKTQISEKELLKKLAAISNKTKWSDAISSALDSGYLTASSSAMLSGTKEAELFLKQLFPKPVKDLDWDKDLLKQYLPLLALGFNANQMKTFRARKDQAKFEAATIITLFGFKCGAIEKATIHQARAAYLWTILADRFSEYDLKPSGTAERISDQFSKKIFCSVVGAKQNRLDLATKQLVGDAVAAASHSLEAIKITLIKTALSSPSKTKTTHIEDFADQVKAVAKTLKTYPFDDEVAISQVYDAYGKKFPDAGKLNEFKTRLLNARQQGFLTLIRLDSPRLVDKDIRTRSELVYDQIKVHLISKT